MASDIRVMLMRMAQAEHDREAQTKDRGGGGQQHVQVAERREDEGEDPRRYVRRRKTSSFSSSHRRRSEDSMGPVLKEGGMKIQQQATEEEKVEVVIEGGGKRKSRGKENVQQYPTPPPPRILRQLHIDVGQKAFGHVVCGICGMIYTPGVAEDERLHLQMCPRPSEKDKGGRKKEVWKRPKVVAEVAEGRVILVASSSTTSSSFTRTKEMANKVEGELGMQEGWLLKGEWRALLLLVPPTDAIAGMVVIEEVKNAFKVGVEEERGEGGGVITYDGRHQLPAKLGVRGLWVEKSARRRGIASTLLDSARTALIGGYVVPKHLIAFSQPTEAGRKFAQSYTEERFLVYTDGSERGEGEGSH